MKIRIWNAQISVGLLYISTQRKYEINIYILVSWMSLGISPGLETVTLEAPQSGPSMGEGDTLEGR